MSNEKEVFVTYSWDNEEHQAKVYGLTNWLREKGGEDANMDLFKIQDQTATDFKRMMHQAITDSKKVIIVLSPGYKEKAETFRGGVGNEFALVLK